MYSTVYFKIREVNELLELFKIKLFVYKVGERRFIIFF